VLHEGRALEKAIGMEARVLTFTGRPTWTRRTGCQDLLKDLALDELRHKYTLEKAFFEETVSCMIQA